MERKYLSISRNLGQKVWIDGQTCVEIRRIKGRNRVTLVFSAPESVKIEREERVLKEGDEPDPALEGDQ